VNKQRSLLCLQSAVRPALTPVLASCTLAHTSSGAHTSNCISLQVIRRRHGGWSKQCTRGVGGHTAGQHQAIGAAAWSVTLSLSPPLSLSLSLFFFFFFPC
jgi:hypothetical protein